MAGALRREELSKMTIGDISDLQSALLIRVPDTKTKKPRSFTITGNENLRLYHKYLSLRPPSMNSDRFFVKYQNGKCHKQIVGIHKLASTAQDVAKYFNLPDFTEYTGHCLRRTSATLLVNAGADLLQLKRHGGWQSSTVAEGYIDESISNKLDTSKKILDCTITAPSTSTSCETSNLAPSTSTSCEISNLASENVNSSAIPHAININENIHNNVEHILKNTPFQNPVQFTNCTNCTVNVTFNINTSK